MNFIRLAVLLRDAAMELDNPGFFSPGGRADLVQDLKQISTDIYLEQQGLSQFGLKHGEVIGLLDDYVVQWDGKKKQPFKSQVKPDYFRDKKLSDKERTRIGLIGE